MKRWTPWILALVLAPTLWVQVMLVHDGAWDWHFTAGLVLIVPSFAGWVIARHQLGDALVGRAEARTLVTHGLYARIRHPVYVSAECLSLGIIIFMHAPRLLALWIPAVLWQISRARRETRVLETAFGEAFREYRRTTWF